MLQLLLSLHTFSVASTSIGRVHWLHHGRVHVIPRPNMKKHQRCNVLRSSYPSWLHEPFERNETNAYRSDSARKIKAEATKDGTVCLLVDMGWATACKSSGEAIPHVLWRRLVPMNPRPNPKLYEPSDTPFPTERKWPTHCNANLGRFTWLIFHKAGILGHVLRSCASIILFYQKWWIHT